MVEKDKFLNSLKNRVFLLDGAMGTMLQKHGFTKGCPDELNIKNKELVKKIHKDYAEAGSDLIITNTSCVSSTLTITLQNKGLFKADAVYIRIGDKNQRVRDLINTNNIFTI